MLNATFSHVQGIGPTTERRMWESGILTWDAALAAPPETLPLGAAQRSLLPAVLRESEAALAAGDYRYFAGILPMREHWRAAPHFRDRIGFLDIETDGTVGDDAITVIGVYDGFESRVYVKGQDLDQFAEDSRRYAMWVTFFGGGFDLPMLRRRFPNLPFDQLHIDLCPALRRLGWSGGLKKIERDLGISRRPEVDGLDGWAAVELWQRWRRNRDKEALHLLLTYNREDIENLSTLLDFAYPRLLHGCGYPSPDPAAP